MKRPLTLIGLIIGLLSNLVVGGLVTFVSYIVASIVAGFGGEVAQLFPLLLLIIFILVVAIFNGIAISIWNKPHDVYKRGVWKLVVAICLNFSVIIYCINQLIVSDGKVLVNLLLIVLLMLANIFILTDLIKEKRNKQLEE